MSTVTVRIQSTYEDGHASAKIVTLEQPANPADLEDWWQDEVFPHTGDGHGAKHPKLGVFYEAIIDTADEPLFVGLSNEWSS